VLIEVGYAHLSMPGAVAVTDRRLLFLGRGFLSRRSAWLSIPRDGISHHEVRQGLGGTELHVDVADKHFELIDLERHSADRIDALLRERNVSDGLELQLSFASPKIVPRWLVVVVVVAGLVLCFKWPLLGVAVIFAALASHFAQAERARMRGG
jgi:hypothetical protein